MQAITRALCARRRTAAVLLVLAVALGATCAGPAAASTRYSAADANPRPIPWTGWNGVPIQRPHKAVPQSLLGKASFPRSWHAGAVRFGSGYRLFNGSKRVKEVQRRLTRLGYHTGPIDGLLGPLTRSSIEWFQIKHGLRPTGVVAASTLAFLRHPKDPTGGLKAHAKNRPAPQATPKPAPKPNTAPKHKPAAPAQPTGKGAPGWLLPLLIALGVALAAAAIAVVLRRRQAKGDAAPEPDLPVIGYVSSESPEHAEAQAAVIAEACEDRGWELEQVVHDRWDARAPSFRRPGLSHALDRLRTGSASRLVVNELEQLAESLAELQLVLAWFIEENAALTAFDVDLDTDTREGRAAVAEVLQLSTNGEQAAENGPGDRDAIWYLVDDPELLMRRIRKMRANGMSFQSIADTLNTEGVEAPNEEGRWRPSSVRLVLGTARFRTGSRSR
jgi:Putative peptidoglycan binding domain/Resolvase, N terminal domain/Recombinase